MNKVKLTQSQFNEVVEIIVDEVYGNMKPFYDHGKSFLEMLDGTRYEMLFKADDEIANDLRECHLHVIEPDDDFDEEDEDEDSNEEDVYEIERDYPWSSGSFDSSKDDLVEDLREDVGNAFYHMIEIVREPLIEAILNTDTEAI